MTYLNVRDNVVLGITEELLERIRIEVVTACLSLPHGGAETAGVLLGAVREGKPTIVEVSDYCSCSLTYPHGPMFDPNSADGKLLENLVTCLQLEGHLVVGWYTSHTRTGPEPRQEEVKFHCRLFPAGWQCLLLFQPNRSGETLLIPHYCDGVELVPAPADSQRKLVRPIRPARQPLDDNIRASIFPWAATQISDPGRETKDEVPSVCHNKAGHGESLMNSLLLIGFLVLLVMALILGHIEQGIAGQRKGSFLRVRPEKGLVEVTVSPGLFERARWPYELVIKDDSHEVSTVLSSGRGEVSGVYYKPTNRDCIVNLFRLTSTGRRVLTESYIVTAH